VAARSECSPLSRMARVKQTARRPRMPEGARKRVCTEEETKMAVGTYMEWQRLCGEPLAAPAAPATTQAVAGSSLGLRGWLGYGRLIASITELLRSKQMRRLPRELRIYIVELALEGYTV
jgi:hypothetical protein